MNLDWIAGFFDGEGSVSLLVGGLRRKRKDFRYGFVITPKIAISQKDPTVLHQIKQFLGYGFVSGHDISIKKNSDVLRFLNDVGSRCSVKRPQVELLQKAMPHFVRSGKWISKKDMLILLDYLAQLRELNKFRNVKMWNMPQLRERVMNFNEEAWQEHRHNMCVKGWDKRIRKKARLTANLVQELYSKDLLTQEEIGKRFDCTAAVVCEFMHEHKMQTRGAWTMGTLDRLRVTPAHIHQLYYSEQLTMKQIAGEYDCSSSAVLSFMRRNNIPRRSKSEAMMLSHQSPRAL
jgi:hypothetical protein